MDSHQSMPRSPSVQPDEAVEEYLRIACRNLSSKLRQGTDCAAEDYLAQRNWTAESALELIYTEFVVRQQLGQKPSPDDWRARFPEWRDDLEELFEVHQFVTQEDQSDSRLDGTTAMFATGETQSDHPRVASSGSVPGYEILEEIGRGGMGVVYRARQLSVNRVVALKMTLTSQHDSADEQQRFHQEAEAAASLHHPHIAEVFAAGHEHGYPFLAMEFVEGTNLEGLMARAPLTATSAAELLAALAEAVHYAHQQGIIHRDLKPSNVLMTVDGVPKITDFGLARRFDTPDDANITRTGVVLGTPSYMPPEQATGNTRDVSPAADIYALGAILYEMLTGRPPFVSDSALETLRLVQEHPPVAPRQLDPSLSRDIETICLKCLEKEPNRRYATAQQLADEARRFLAGEPILARPLGTAARLGRWCRRQPVVAGLMATVGLLLVALAVGGSWFGWRQSVLRGRALAESQKSLAAEQRADQSAAEANAVTDYLVKTFRSPDPWLEGKQVTMAKALDNALENLEADWPDDAAAKAALCEAFARTLSAWGEYDRALQLAQQAYDMRVRLAGHQDTATLQVATLLANCLLASDRVDEGLALITDVHQQLQNAVIDDIGMRIKAATVLAKAHQTKDNYSQAIELLEETHRQSQAHLGRFDTETQKILSLLVMARQHAGQMGTLTEWLSAELKEARTENGDDSQVVVELGSMLADSLRMAGDIQQAVQLYEQNLDRLQRILGDEHPTTLVAMNNLAAGYAEAGRRTECTELMEQILPVRQRMLGPDHRQTMGAMHNLAMCYYNQSRDQEALELLRETLHKREMELGPQHRETLETKTALGRVLMMLRHWDECLPLVKSNLADMQAVHGPDHPETLDTAWVLGTAYHHAGRFADAVDVLQPTHQAMVKRFGATNPRTLRCLNTLVVTYRDLGDVPQACELQEFVVRSFEQQLGTAHVNTHTAKLNYGTLLSKAERYDAAERELQALIASMKGQTDVEPRTLPRAQLALGEVLTAKQQYAAAEPHLLAAAENLSKLSANNALHYGQYHSDAVQTLVRLYTAWGKPERAHQWSQEERATLDE